MAALSSGSGLEGENSTRGDGDFEALPESAQPTAAYNAKMRTPKTALVANKVFRTIRDTCVLREELPECRLSEWGAAMKTLLLRTRFSRSFKPELLRSETRQELRPAVQAESLGDFRYHDGDAASLRRRRLLASPGRLKFAWIKLRRPFRAAIVCFVQ